ncbi:MAG: hypothetical protein ACRCU1_05175 [Alsobacter sp.]
MKFEEVLAVYNGSDGDSTKAMYGRLEALGAAGFVACNVFRAMKASERAKAYRGRKPGGGRYRDMAYDRKQWAMDNLAQALSDRGEALGISWGWAVDPAQAYHCYVLYIDLPTGQVSFHTAARGRGPDYAGQWDGVRNWGPTRICKWCVELFEAAKVRA